MLLCECDCGNICSVTIDGLLDGRVTSCGCDRQPTSWVGRKFGEWTVLEDYPDSYFNKKFCLCQCSCGITRLVDKRNLTTKKSVGCGRRHQQQVRVREDLTGRKFGRLTVIGRGKDSIRNNGAEIPTWVCKCECGNIVSVEQCLLKSGGTKSCGCFKSESSSERFSLKLEGRKFGKLTVIKRNGTITNNDGTQHLLWLCQCECGNQKEVRGGDLTTGKVKSCGCMSSYGEEIITKVLVDNNIKFVSQFTFPDLLSEKGHRLRFDFAVLNEEQKLLFLLEYQGIQHYVARQDFKNDFGKRQREVTDEQKKNYCLEHNIILEEITYKQDTEEEIKEILKKYKLIK